MSFGYIDPPGSVNACLRRAMVDNAVRRIFDGVPYGRRDMDAILFHHRKWQLTPSLCDPFDTCEVCQPLFDAVRSEFRKIESELART